MSIRMGVLAVLAEGDLYAYEIKRRFEDRTGGAWPLNLAQVTSILARLTTNGLVAEVGGPASEPMQREVKRYALTASGRDDLDAWWTTGVDRATPPRDELSVKVALALSDPSIDGAAVLEAQRRCLLRDLQDLTRLVRHDDRQADPLWRLTLDRMMLLTEAEIEWLGQVSAKAPAMTDRLRARHPSPHAAAEDDSTPANHEAAR